MKYLRRVGFVSSLLVVGILGGLLAPLPSEAVPTVTLKVDSGIATPILTTGTCPVETGYTACYTINTGLTVPGAGATINRSYLVRNAPGATARLRVADLAGQDKLSLVGVQFVPAPLAGQTVANWNTATNTTANTSETHKLTITMSNAFDSATTNTTNAGNYVWAIRAGGEFRAGPTAAGACAGAACNTIGNSVTFPGTGTFSPTLVSKPILSPSGKNSQALSFTVAGPTNPIVSFNGLTNATLGQENPTYPTFLCDTNGTTAGGACRPSITEVMTVTLKGPDSFVLVNGGDNFGASCAATLTATQEKQIALLTTLVGFLDRLEQRRPNAELRDFISRMQAFLARVNTPQDPECPGARLVDLDIALAAAIDQAAFVADGAVPAEPEPPAPQTGTITITKNTNQATNETFFFDVSGPTSSTDPISMAGGNSETLIIPVDAGTYNISEISIADGWTLTSASCVGTGDGISNGVVGVVVPAGGNVNCTFNNGRTFIRITKQLTFCDGACPPLTFNFHIVGPTTMDVTVPTNSEGSGFTHVDVETGTYSIEEFSNPPDWHFSSSTCTGGSSGGNPSTGIVLPAGSGGGCHFQNNHSPVAPPTGTIVIRAEWLPSGGIVTVPLTLTFDFTGTGEGIADFSITSITPQGVPPEIGHRVGSKTFNGLLTGAAGASRTITQTTFPISPPPPLVEFTHVGCVVTFQQTAGVFSTWNTEEGGRSVTVTNLADGDTLTCSFSNSIRPPGSF